MKAVFIVTHSYELQGAEQIKIIGAYASKKDAQLAVRRKKRYPGFRKYPKGFYIDCFELGRDQWDEGFITYYYTPKKKSSAKSRKRKSK